MPHTNTTQHYSLPIFIASDKPGWLSDWNEAMNALDAAIYEASQTGSGDSTTAQEALAKAEQALTEATNAASAAASAVSTASSANTTATSANTKATKNATDIATINSTLATMQTALTTAQNNITTLQQNYAALDTKATTANTNASTALSTANQAKTNANSASQEAATAKTIAESANSKSNANATAITGLQSRMSTAETKITQLESADSTNQNPIVIPFYVTDPNPKNIYSGIGMFYVDETNHTATFSIFVGIRAIGRESSTAESITMLSNINPFEKYPWMEPANSEYCLSDVPMSYMGTEYIVLKFRNVGLNFTGSSSGDLQVIVDLEADTDNISRGVHGVCIGVWRYSGNEWTL